MVKIKRWLKTYGIKNVFLRGLYSKLWIIPVSDNELLRRMNWQLHCRKKIRKYLVVNQDMKSEKTKESKIIWWLWFQGSENAPLIVKLCLESVKHYATEMGYRVIELNENNLFEYVELPDLIIDKWKNGKIENAQFSDLCRVALLAEWGGMWIDSTVYLTDTFDEEIQQANLFFFQASFLDMSVTKISSWFMSSKYAHNMYMVSLRDSMINYWMNNNSLNDYFLFHIMAGMLLENPLLQKEVEIIPYYSNTYPQLLGMTLQKLYDKDKYNHIIKLSSIHKLTYKNLDYNKNDTYLDYIINAKGRYND